MKKLNRSNKPPCLSMYRHGVNQWRDLSTNKLHHTEIWNALNIMQRGFCAYCECKLTDGNRHIEHFRQKKLSQFPKLTFVWENLFGSCNTQTRCGVFKDHKAKNVDPALLIKPDECNPSGHIVFLINGCVEPRLDLNHHQLRIAEETIRVFNLQGDAGLVNERRKLYENNKTLIQPLYDLIEEYGMDSCQEYLDELKDELKNQGFHTALEDYFFR